jgi:hypothetical protein
MIPFSRRVLITSAFTIAFGTPAGAALAVPDWRRDRPPHLQCVSRTRRPGPT